MHLDTKIFELIAQEEQRQLNGIELIASENFTSPQVRRAMGSVLTHKYAEGYPGKRYYGGCEVIDQIEQLAIDRAKQLFGATWTNVQPHSGAQANAAIFLSVLNAGDAILGFNLSHGGHLSHGSPVNFSGKNYNAFFYGVELDTGKINMNAVNEIAQKVKPKLIICGASAYSQEWEYEKFRQIADSVNALLLADIAHPAGLIASKLLSNPLNYCHIVSTTTHKTLRGPRGGMIMMGNDFENPFGQITLQGNPKLMSAVLDSGVFPGMQGGPLEHIIAAKAIAFEEALSPEFITYSQQVINNAQVMANALLQKNYHIVSGGTQNHLMLIDLRNKNISGKKAEELLGKAHITVNKNMVPFDTKSPFVTSGIRIGTPAITTRGMLEKDMIQIVEWIDEIILNHDNELKINQIGNEVLKFSKNFPLFA